MKAANPKQHQILKRSSLKRTVAIDENTVLTTTKEVYATKHVQSVQSSTTTKQIQQEVISHHDENIPPESTKVAATMTRKTVQMKQQGIKRNALGQVNSKFENAQNIQAEDQDVKVTRPKVVSSRLKIPNVRPTASKIPTGMYQVAKPRPTVPQVAKGPISSYVGLRPKPSTTNPTGIRPPAVRSHAIKPIIPPVIIPSTDNLIEAKRRVTTMNQYRRREESESGKDITIKNYQESEMKYMDYSEGSADKRRKNETAVKKAIQDEPEFDEQLEFWDTGMAAEYSKDIFDYYIELERKYMANPNYMDFQIEIEWHMRSILIDWLVQVHARFRLLPETLYLTINVIDRFLSIKSVSLQKLQLVGAAALFIASKFEEISYPSVHEIVFMVDNGYAAEQILIAERFMLNQLKFEMGWPGPMSFLRRCSKADDYDLQTRTLAKYLIEVTLMDERFLHYSASQCAAAGYYLSRYMLRRGKWEKAHQHYSGYKEDELGPIANIILELLMTPKKHEAIYHKYADVGFMSASHFVQKWLRDQQQ